MELLTAAQMRADEGDAIEGGKVTGLELMERAGRGVVDTILKWRPELESGEYAAAVMCGPGNNGGDGFVIARLLKQRGWEVEVFLYGNEANLPPDAAENARRWRELGDIETGSMDPISLRMAQSERPCELVIDALFGTGLTRPIEPDLGAIMRDVAIDDAGIRNFSVVSVDIPTGICADSGKVLGSTLRADLTVTFHEAKLGHYLAEGPFASGAVQLVDIGLPAKYEQARVRRSSFDTRFTLRYPDGHKYSHGHALVLSGPMGKSGAARLAARAALRVGAGLVTVGAPGSAMLECAAQLTAIMLRKSDGPEGLAALLSDERINALCLGPALGTENARTLVPIALSAQRATVLDADALSAYNADPGALFARLHENCVLTPHAGEFGRLFPDIHAKLAEPVTSGPAYSKVDATRDASKRAGCVVLLKGPDTVIAGPDGRCVINCAFYEREAPWLATAGSGDVLAGMIAGLMARGVPAFDAAQSAAWLHVEAGRRLGPGLIAEDIPEALPDALKAALGWKPPS